MTSLLDLAYQYTLPIDDVLELTEVALTLIIETLLDEPNLYIQPTFPVPVLQIVTQLLNVTLLEHDELDFFAEEDLQVCIKNAMHCWYTLYAPRRSLPEYNTAETTNASVFVLKQQIEFLQNIPQPQQRTPEWYDFRHKYLTASNIWKAFHTECSRNQLIYDKCKPINIDKYNSVCTESPMHWGQKYEAVSILLYEERYNTKISDFGCLPHSAAHIHFLAASPDGINTLETSSRYGRMLEVKNIVNRDIDGIPKLEYWVQMQLQMEVCNLPLCDFLETRFKEYASLEEFLLDGPTEDAFAETKDGRPKGVMLYFIKEGKPFYVCKPLHIQDTAAFQIWEEETMLLYQELSWMTNIYWYLDQFSCVVVERNQFWFQQAVPTLQLLWKTIEKERLEGSDHRAPTKRIKTAPVNAPVNTPANAPVNAQAKTIDMYFQKAETIVVRTGYLGNVDE
jgi:hypothetical protein